MKSNEKPKKASLATERFEKLLNAQPRKRKEKIKILASFLKNEGRFSTLVLGDRGTGKKYWTGQVSISLEKKFHLVNAALTEATVSYWEEQFQKADNGVLVIKDVEKLGKDSQELLFEGLSTLQGEGLFGFENKIYAIHPVFTSSKHISMLRDSDKYLNPKFFDRTAQLVVKFPNFKECGNGYKNDLQSCWEHFSFNTDYPKKLEDWLETKMESLHGSFRDLHKMCINWNNYQKAGWNENDILKQIENDFNDFYHIPEQNKDAIFEIHFSDGKTYQELQDEFKKQLKSWAKEAFSSNRKAAEMLQISHRTMERW